MKKAVFAVLSVLAVMVASSRGQMPEPKAKIGEKAPAFTLANYDGNNVSLSDYKGKIVVLEWLNYECPFSRYHHETANTMVNLAEKYKSKNVAWLAINSTGHATAEKDKEFAAQFEIPYPILSDFTGDVGHLYGAKTTPHMFIIDPNGILVYDGAIDNSPLGRKKEGVINYVDKALGELTSGKKVTVPETKPYGCSVKYNK
jgi:peroxiredoxin